MTFLLSALPYLFFLVLLLLIWGRHYEPHAYRLRYRSVNVGLGLSREIKILHLSNTHFFKKTSQLDGFFKKLKIDIYDLIFITGDIIDEGTKGLPVCQDYLLDLKSKYGIYAVLGNHDYANYDLKELIVHSFQRDKIPKVLHDVNVFKKGLNEIGVRLLMNETVELVIEGKRISLHGLDDPVTKHDQPEKIKENLSKEMSNILLVHSVDGLIKLKNDPIALSFSGHTHGGQIRVPHFGALLTHTKLGRKYACGLPRYYNIQCCVSRGVGTSRFLPIRLFCKPEAIVLSVS